MRWTDSPSRAEAVLRRLLILALAVGLAHPVYRALHLGVEYFDGYDYLRNARALAGEPSADYQRLRPPFVSIVQLPAMAVVAASPPAAPIRLLAPHLNGVAVSILGVGAVLWLFARTFGTTLALLGALLFVSTRYFVHYAPHVMADLPSAGFTAATVALYLRARERRTYRAFACCGLALGGCVLVKYPLVVFAAALPLAELWLAARARRIDWRCVSGVGIAGALGAALFLIVQIAVMSIAFGAEGLGTLTGTLREFTTMTGGGERPDESWRDYGALSVAMLSLPTLVLAGVGVLLAVLRPRTADIACLASLLLIGATTVVWIGHTEARYLLPAVPFLLYFVLRSIEAALALLRPRWGGLGKPARALALAVAAGLLAGALRVGVHQALLEEDPVYRADAERRAAELLLSVRSGRGLLLWDGHFHTLHTRWAGFVPQDEFFGVFHYPKFAAEYFLDRRIASIPLPRPLPPKLLPEVLEDGDAMLRVSGRLFAAPGAPHRDVPPMQVWSVQRLRFRALGDDRFQSVAEPARLARLHRDASGVALSAEVPAGTWQVLLFGDRDAAPLHAGTLALKPGVPTPLAHPPAGPLRAIELFRIGWTRIEQPGARAQGDAAR